MAKFRSATCEGEICRCGDPADHKIIESIPLDDPHPDRHGYSTYACHPCFVRIMGPAVAGSNDLSPADRDNCEFCLGEKGGVKGNENVIGGKIVCDYCTAILMDIKKAAVRDLS